VNVFDFFVHSNFPIVARGEIRAKQHQITKLNNTIAMNNTIRHMTSIFNGT